MKLLLLTSKQRYESLQQFYHNKFKLREEGLTKLKDLAGKKYETLPCNARDIFEDYKVKMLCYTIIDPSTTQEKKEFFQRDIYKRYNYGKTQLQEHEVARAKYLHDNLTQDFIEVFQQDNKFYDECVRILLPKSVKALKDVREQKSLLMVTVRELLIMPYVPIIGEKTIQIGAKLVDQYYGTFFGGLSKSERDEVKVEFRRILKKMAQIKEKLELDQSELQDNVLFFKAIYWMLAILYKFYSNQFYSFNNDRLCHYVEDGGEVYFQSYNSMTRDHIKNRYEYLAEYLQNELKLDLDKYIEEVKGNKEKTKYVKKEEIDPNKDWTGIKADSQVIATKEKLALDEVIGDIKKNRFIIQPEYQRAEVKSIMKASKLIESIILGVKLPPIYIHRVIQESGRYRDSVLDGQQRLISILSYMGEPITVENGECVKAYKNKYALKGLDDMNGLENSVYEEGPNSLNEFKRKPIKDYVFDVVRMTARGNEKFDFVDMFVRLNQNNYSLSVNSFEMWNCFEIVKIIRRIREVAKYKLFRQPGKRMKEEELVTVLAYLDYHNVTIHDLKGILDTVLRTDNRDKRNEIVQVKISFHKNKNVITKFLEGIQPDSEEEMEFAKSVENVNEFADKLKMLSGDDDNRLIKIFNPNTTNRRVGATSDFYLMWLILKKLDTHIILTYRKEILKDLESVFQLMKNMPKGKDEKDFMQYVKDIIDKYPKYCR